NHYIIFGGGRVGEHIASMLKHNRKKFIIVDKDEAVVNMLKAKRYDALMGDVLDEKVFYQTGIERAKAVISVLGETEKNLLVTLTAKGLNPRVKVFTRSEKKELIEKLKKAGADYVVMPEFLAAEEIFGHIEKHEKTKW
ncbi:MAG: NAD(P)-binding protein, partial [archaeon]